jgi:DnaK suppressor protein
MNMRHYEERLLELETSLSARTDRALADAGAQFIDTAHDTGDSSAAATAATDSFTAAELDSAILGQVREALDRIANGTYGKCLADGEKIEAKRLEAVPWAAYCLKHQGLIEAAARPRTR